MDNSQRPTPEDYFKLFQLDRNGQNVLTHLTALFYDVQTFDADPYKHAYAAGKREVVRFILNQCGLSQQQVEVNDE